jgi:hypothetical protein
MGKASERREPRLRLRAGRRTATVELPVGSGFVASYLPAQRPGEQPDVSAYSLAPEDSKPRHLPIEVMREAARKGPALEAFAELIGNVHASGGHQAIERHGVASEWRSSIKQPRRRRDDRRLARVAAVYVKHHERGSTSPTADTAQELGCPRPYAAKMIGLARERGILTGTSQGKSGGRLADYGQRLLGR